MTAGKKINNKAAKNTTDAQNKKTNSYIIHFLIPSLYPISSAKKIEPA